MSQQPPYPPQGYGYYPPPGQQPPPGQPPYQQPPPGGYPGYGSPPPQGQGQQPGQYAPPGQYPPQQPGQYPPQQPGQYPPQQQPGQYPPQQPGQYPPQQPGQYPPQQPGQYPPQQPYGGAYGQQPPQPGYPPQGHSPYPPQQQPYGAPPPGQQPQQWGQQQPVGYPAYNVQPTPASQGYDTAQKQWVQPVDTSSDVEAIRKAMKGMGCDEKALIKVLASPKYSNPWAMAQLVNDYNKRFIRDLAKDIESETRGDLEDALLALIRGPLQHDIYTLDKALNRAGTDEEALMDVLLCRSNADLRAIAAEYKRVHRKELLAEIKDDVEDTLYRLYSMVLAANRAEDAAPVIPAEIDAKVTELQRATEGTIGSNGIAVAQVLASSNAAQIHAMTDAYARKYHRSLEEVIEKEFRGDMEDALLRLILSAKDRARADAERIRAPLTKTMRKDKLLIHRILALYWNPPRLAEAKAAYKKAYYRTLSKDLKEILSGDYEDLMMALVGKE